jgi:hypothetical protein
MNLTAAIPLLAMRTCQKNHAKYRRKNMKKKTSFIQNFVSGKTIAPMKTISSFLWREKTSLLIRTSFL